MTGCVSSRVATKCSEFRVESLESVEKVDSIVVESSDTVREVTTITIDRNDKGDTLRLTTVTDRERVRVMSDVRSKKADVVVKTDTVYIQKDSLVVKEIPHQVRNEGNGGLFGRDRSTGRQGLIAGLTRNLRWLFFVLLAIVALILLIRVKHLLN